MTTYFDSSALVPIYVPERFSTVARAEVVKAGQVPFTAIHELEILNTFELLAGRRQIANADRGALITQLREDLDAQRLVVTGLDFERVFADAVELSRRHSARYLTRSLGLLHVAAAHAIGAGIFVSADDRQLQAARASGSTVVDIKRRPRRRPS